MKRIYQFRYAESGDLLGHGLGQTPAEALDELFQAWGFDSADNGAAVLDQFAAFPITDREAFIAERAAWAVAQRDRYAFEDHWLALHMSADQADALGAFPEPALGGLVIGGRA